MLQFGREKWKARDLSSWAHSSNGHNSPGWAGFMAGAKSFIQVSQMGSWAQALGHLLLFRCISTECIESGAAGTQTGVHVGYERCTKRLNLLCHNAIPWLLIFNLFPGKVYIQVLLWDTLSQHMLVRVYVCVSLLPYMQISLMCLHMPVPTTWIICHFCPVSTLEEQTFCHSWSSTEVPVLVQATPRGPSSLLVDPGK